MEGVPDTVEAPPVAGGPAPAQQTPGGPSAGPIANSLNPSPQAIPVTVEAPPVPRGPAPAQQAPGLQASSGLQAPSGGQASSGLQVPSQGQASIPSVPVAPTARSAPSQDPVASSELAPPSAHPSVAPAAATTASGDADVYSHAASNHVSGGCLEQTVQQILDISGGIWDPALRAAFNNPERTIDYLYSGIPETVQALPVARGPGLQSPSQGQADGGASAGPNANPLILFSQGIPETVQALPVARGPGLQSPSQGQADGGASAGPNANPLILFSQSTHVAASTPSVPVASAARSPPSQASVASSQPAPPSAQPSAATTASGEADVYIQAASNLVSGGGLEQTVQQILDIGGGMWDYDMVVRALRAAFNNPERAINFLPGLPDTPLVARGPAPSQGQAIQPNIVPQVGVTVEEQIQIVTKKMKLLVASDQPSKSTLQKLGRQKSYLKQELITRRLFEEEDNEEEDNVEDVEQQEGDQLQ